MASTNGSEQVGPAAEVARTGATVVQGRSTGASASPAATMSQDPDVLAAEIERTREDLAETLDAIADKVSPKRVADRTRKRVSEVADNLKEKAIEQAGVAREKVVEQAGVAREAATTAKGKVVEQAGAAKERVSGVTGGSVALSRADGGLPPVTGVPVAGLDLADLAPPTPTTASTYGAPLPVTGSSAGPEAKKEYVAGGAAGLLVLLLLRRRRRSRRRRAALAVATLKTTRRRR